MVWLVAAPFLYGKNPFDMIYYSGVGNGVFAILNLRDELWLGCLAIPFMNSLFMIQIEPPI